MSGDTRKPSRRISSRVAGKSSRPMMAARNRTASVPATSRCRASACSRPARSSINSKSEWMASARLMASRSPAPNSVGRLGSRFSTCRISSHAGGALDQVRTSSGASGCRSSTKTAWALARDRIVQAERQLGPEGRGNSADSYPRQQSWLARLGRRVHQTIERGQILFKVLHGVVIDLVPLQESIDLHPCGETQELANLLHGELARTVRFNSKIFQKNARQITAR